MSDPSKTNNQAAELPRPPASEEAILEWLYSISFRLDSLTKQVRLLDATVVRLEEAHVVSDRFSKLILERLEFIFERLYK